MRRLKPSYSTTFTSLSFDWAALLRKGIYALAWWMGLDGWDFHVGHGFGKGSLECDRIMSFADSLSMLVVST